MSAYVEFKLAHELYKRPPLELDAGDRARLAEIAGRQRHMEAAILATPEAARVVVAPEAITAQCAEIRARYDDEAAYLSDLAGLGLDASALEAEIARELRVSAVLDDVAARAPAVSDIDAELHYRMNPGRFRRPEQRRLRHILVTFDGPAERRAADALLRGLAAAIVSEDGFARAAATHSHCPTGVDGGVIGTVPRGRLYAEIEAAAFALAEGGLSEPVETEVGLHLVRCDAIVPPTTPAFVEVRERIRGMLGERRKDEAQRRWIALVTRKADRHG